ncbi:DNA-packaging protein [Aureimonas glaciei]|uniref:DNA-packaging protein n=2 Tax=Aureimonas glaciei TaxID=1776957 RepID=A0A917D7N5_9HYPH|nr:DNA-packaging protein [Aureimonas glaciei]
MKRRRRFWPATTLRPEVLAARPAESGISQAGIIQSGMVPPGLTQPGIVQPGVVPPDIDEAEFWELAGKEVESARASVLGRAMPGWALVARPSQLPPPGDWRQWLILGGRGSGKTRAGAEWVRAMVEGVFPAATRVHGRIALVAETLADAREVMVEGESGLRANVAGPRPVYEATRRRLVFGNGAVAQIFSSEDPESLRGYQFDAAWGDELAKWKHADACFDNLQLGLRLGERPRALFTTTPRPVPLLQRMLAEAGGIAGAGAAAAEASGGGFLGGEPLSGLPAISPPRGEKGLPSGSGGTVVTHMRTDENADNLGAGFVEAMAARYGGSRLGRQELFGEMIADREDALFDRAGIDRMRVRAAPALRRIVVAVDPPATATKRSDACGIVAAGISADGTIYVLADHSRQGLKPHEWARAAVGLYTLLEADRIVAEVNQGGDMVEAVIRTVAPSAPVRAVRASRGKWVRAEPVAALYEQGRVRHAGSFPALEDEMADFGPDGLSSGRSPDRLDALVWAVTALAGPSAEPRVRGL